VVLALSDSPRLHALAARNFVRDKVRISARPPSTANRRRDKMRIAYVAADNFSDVGARPIANLAALHDRTKFDVIGMSFGRAVDSEFRAALVVSFDQFHDVTARTDAAAARLLRELEVDIAVDLDGYVEDGRPGIFATRSAPIQVNFGYPATMGAESSITSWPTTVLPFDQQKLITEKIVHLPDCHQASEKKPELSPELPSREVVGLPATGFVFCCFAESLKIARPVFDVWMRLLSRNQGSVLWLSRGSDAACARLRGEATARDPARLVFASGARAEHSAPLARRRLPRYAAVQRGTASDALRAGAGRDRKGSGSRPARRQPAHGSRSLRSDRRRPAGYEAQARSQRSPNGRTCCGARVRHRSVPPPRGSGLCQDVRAAAQQHPAAELRRRCGMTQWLA
jgi:predicted O-linked N-acetylglucosamine transferase (SPINDLY family)